MKKDEYAQIEKLYHYTTMGCLRKILQYKTLLFGKLPKMNDINERQKEAFVEDKRFNKFPSVIFAKISRELKLIGQISLTEDKKKKSGLDIPAMWGHYAKNGNGVCIVFDKSKIIERCNKEGYKYEEIKYQDSVSPISYVLGKYESVHSFLKRRAKALFFVKTKDWSYEQEFRILRFDGVQPSMNIDGCIIALVLYYNTNKSIFNTSKYKKLKQIAGDIPILVYSNTALWGFSLVDENADDWFDKSSI